MIILAWWLCLIPIVGYFLYNWVRPWLRLVIFALSLPGPPAIPLIGNIFMSHRGTKMVKLFTTGYNNYGPIFRAWISFLPVIFVFEPKYLQPILGSTKLTDKAFIYSIMHNFVGKGLITNSGNAWKSHRKYIQPYFNLNIFEQCIPTFIESSQIMVNNLKNSSQIKITSAVNKCVFDMLHQTILGIPLCDQQAKETSPFNRGEKVGMTRALKPWMLLDFVYTFTSYAKREIQHKETLVEFSKKALKELKLKRKNGQLSKFSFLECLLQISENNSDFTEEDIINEACTLMLAGQDSAGAAIAYTLYYLAKHQDIQDKVIQELNDVFLQSPVINMAALHEMKYLEMCIKEAMRINPSVPLIARKLSEDVNLENHVIPAGTTVFISPMGTHHLPHIYPDPDKYDPERFSAENQAERNPFAYLTFSAGPRNCIGYKLAMLEMKTLIATLLRNYQFYLIPGKEELVTTFSLTLRAKGGIWLEIKPRKSAN